MKLPLGRQTPAVHSFDRTNVMSLFPDQSGVSYLEINFPYIPFPYLILSKQILSIGVIQKNKNQILELHGHIHQMKYKIHGFSMPAILHKI